MSRIADMLRAAPNAGMLAEEPSHQGLFGSAAPDSPDLTAKSGVIPLAVANNTLPREDGSYGPLKEPTAVSNALDSIAKGVISLSDSNGVSWLYAADGNRSDAGELYETNDYNFSKVSKGGGPYVVDDEEGWEFAQFRERVIAATIAEPLQSKTIGAAGNFADLALSTNKPQARHIGTIGNFLVLGNTSDATDGLRPNRVWWSGFGDPTTYDPSTTTQSDFEDLPDGGRVQRVVGGQEYGVVMQSEMIRRMTYRGDEAIFDFDPVDRKRGTPIPKSVAARGRLLAYIAEEGFMVFDGLESQEIGDGLVDRTFWNEFDINDRNAISATIDPNQKLIIWAYPANGGTNRLPNKLLVYNYAPTSRRWATLDIECDLIFTGTYLGINVDTPDPRLDDIDNSVWSDRSIDSNIFKGGFQAFSIFDQQHQQASLDGPNLAMRIETKDMSLFSGQAARINQARPIVEGEAQAFIGIRAVQGGQIEYLAEKDKSFNGLVHFADQQTVARYQRFCITAPRDAGWDKASGFQLYADQAGAFFGEPVAGKSFLETP